MDNDTSTVELCFAAAPAQLFGADTDDDKIELLLSEVKGKDITELIAAGREKLASAPSGGGGIAVAAPTGGALAAAEPKKEEKVEEKKESDDNGSFKPI